MGSSSSASSLVYTASSMFVSTSICANDVVSQASGGSQPSEATLSKPDKSRFDSRTRSASAQSIRRTHRKVRMWSASDGYSESSRRDMNVHELRKRAGPADTRCCWWYNQVMDPNYGLNPPLWINDLQPLKVRVLRAITSCTSLNAWLAAYPKSKVDAANYLTLIV